MEQKHRSASCGRFSEAFLAPRSKYSRRCAAEYFGHRKNGIFRPEEFILAEARPVDDISNPPQNNATPGLFVMFHVKHYEKHKRPPFGGPLCFFRGMWFGEAILLLSITDGADAERTGAAEPLAELSATLKALLLGMLTT